jgi:putative membrane protein
MHPFLLRWITTTLALALASHLLRGIHADSVVALVLAGLVLAGLNAALRPLLTLVSLPLIVGTLGLFYLLLNALLLKLAALLVPGFQVVGLGAAVLGSILIGLASWALGHLLGPGAGSGPTIRVHRSGPSPEPPPGEPKPVKGRVIES